MHPCYPHGFYYYPSIIMKSHCHNNQAASGSRHDGKSRIALYAIGFLIGAALVFWVAQSSSSQKEKGSAASSSQEQSGTLGALTFEEKSFSFGNISMAAGPVTKTVRVSNSGSETISLQKLYTSCMCTKASIIAGEKRIGPFGMPGHGFIASFREEIKPGESAQVEITFDPAAHGPSGIGRISRVVTLEHSASRAPSEISFDALVSP